VGAEKNRAKQIETKIIEQLRRNIFDSDVASLADRKRRLLWLFYGLSGYMASTYPDRLSRATDNDELRRLVRWKHSSELRAEVIAALRGSRPPGPEPKG
jgi:hypothetical protein